MLGIKNFLEFINNNWTAIIAIVSLIFAIYKKIKTFIKLSQEEKINIAKSQISDIILKLVKDAEMENNSINKSGVIKRSQVIEKIYSDYPILSKISNQDEIINWIDELIDNSIRELNDILNHQKKEE